MCRVGRDDATVSCCAEFPSLSPSLLVSRRRLSSLSLLALSPSLTSRSLLTSTSRRIRAEQSDGAARTRDSHCLEAGHRERSSRSLAFAFVTPSQVRASSDRHACAHARARTRVRSRGCAAATAAHACSLYAAEGWVVATHSHRISSDRFAHDSRCPLAPLCSRRRLSLLASIVDRSLSPLDCCTESLTVARLEYQSTTTWPICR